MGAVVEIWFESLIPFLLKDSHIVHWLAKKALRQWLLLVSNQPGTACKSKSLTRAATPDGMQEEGAVMIIGAKGIINWNQRHSNKLVKALDARKSLYLLKM